MIESKIPQHEFTLLCDDIRQEMGGKTSLMGIYDHHIVIPEVPFVLPKVCFYTRFSNMAGPYKFSFALTDPTGIKKSIIENSDVKIPDDAKEGTFNVIASPFEVSTEGIYKVTIELTQESDTFEYIYKFAISDVRRLQAEHEVKEGEIV